MRRDGCLEGTPNWRIARFGWMCLWKDGTFVWGGDAELAQERGLAGVWLWKDGTFVLGGRGIGAGARFRWMCL